LPNKLKTLAMPKIMTRFLPRIFYDEKEEIHLNITYEIPRRFLFLIFFFEPFALIYVERIPVLILKVHNFDAIKKFINFTI
jgi:hypothetical protein